MTRNKNIRELIRWNTPAPDRINGAAVKARSCAGYLIRQIHRPIPANEVLIPTHSSIRRGFPGLAAQTTSVNHHDRNMLVAVHRYLILHVHLVDCDVASGKWATRRCCGRKSLLFTADEETSLTLQCQGLLAFIATFLLAQTRYCCRSCQDESQCPVGHFHCGLLHD